LIIQNNFKKITLNANQCNILLHLLLTSTIAKQTCVPHKHLLTYSPVSISSLSLSLLNTNC